MPFMSWATHVLQWPVQRVSEGATWSQSLKAGLSSDCRLQFACMKLESLVIANQHVAVNTFPGLVHTARHTTKACNTRSRWCQLVREAAVEGGASDWGEVVTR